MDNSKLDPRLQHLYAALSIKDNAVAANTIRSLLTAGVNVNAALPDNGGNIQHTGRTALHLAAYARPELAQILIDAGADVNAKDTFGDTPLHKAAVAGNAQGIQMLLDAGAIIEATNRLGNTPLHNAAWTRDKDLSALKVLLSAGAVAARPNKAGETALQKAMEMGNTEAVTLLTPALTKEHTQSRAPIGVTIDRGFHAPNGSTVNSQSTGDGRDNTNKRTPR